jgi:hypothetical protein
MCHSPCCSTKENNVPRGNILILIWLIIYGYTVNICSELILFSLRVPFFKVFTVITLIKQKFKKSSDAVMAYRTWKQDTPYTNIPSFLQTAYDAYFK